MCFSGSGRNRARRTGLAYAVVSLQALAVTVAGMYLAAMSCEASRRLYVWITWGPNCLLGAVNLGFIITWTVAAAQDNVRWMMISVNGIAVRVVGIFVNSLVSFAVNTMSKKHLAVPHLVASALLHQEEIWSTPPRFVSLFVFLIEICFLVSMVAYVESFQSAAEQRQLAEDRSEDSSNTTAAGQTGTANTSKSNE